MKIVIAPDSFKGSLSAREVIECCTVGIHRALPAAEIISVPMADGGEGTVQNLVHATGGSIRHITVTGPLQTPVPAFFGILGDGVTAVIEMAAASGLPLVPEDKRDPRITTTWGTGELLRAAARAGCSRAIVGLGGSATNDGGAGLAQAIGVHLRDDAGRELPVGGAALACLRSIDISDIDASVAAMEIIVASDVRNPLCGPQGASAVYGPQKGATAAMVAELDAALANFAAVIKAGLGKDVADIPGAGAGGGLGAALLAFMNVQIRSGVEIVTELVGLEAAIAAADFVLTGEGSIDGQTSFGKTLSGVARLAKKHNKPLIAIAGYIADDARTLHEHGFSCLFSIVNKPMGLAESTQKARRLVADISEQIARCLVCGAQLGAGGAAPKMGETA